MTQRIDLCGGGVALIDDVDLPLVEGRKWHVSRGSGGKSYAMSYRPGAGRGAGNRDRMHRLILSAPDGVQVDHVNGDTLDNRRVNLRLCSQSENSRNVRRHRDNQSGFKGVSWDRARGKWQAGIVAGGERIALGRFDSPEEAARAYDAAALRLHGAFASINFPGQH